MTASAYADQVAAARRQGAALHNALHALAPFHRSATAGDTPAVTRWVDADPIAGCSHVAHPTPVVGLLARPGVAYCPDCGTDALARHVRRNRHTCDGCGRRSRMFHEVAALLDPFVTIVGNLCPTCTTGDPA